jgi:hypothetical protein
MHYYLLYITLILSWWEHSLEVVCLADRAPVEVKWKVPLVGFRAFYTLVHEWKWLRI